MPERNSTSRRTLVFFLLFLLLVLAFLCMSFVYIVLVHYSNGLFPKIVIVTGIVFIGLICTIIIQAYIKKKIVCESKFPICHDLWEEYTLCARCRGFYVGLGLFGIMLAIRNTIYMDLLRTIGAFPYLVVTFLIMSSVPMHGALRRLEIITSTKWLFVVGFVFSNSIYLIGNFLVFLLYGV